MTDDIKCPRCGSKTILRTAKKGSNAGNNFYVCVKYPKCKGKILKSNDVKQTKIVRLNPTPVSVLEKTVEPKSEQAVKIAEPISQKPQENNASAKPSLEKRYENFADKHMTFAWIVAIIMFGAIGFGIFKACDAMDLGSGPCDGLYGQDKTDCEQIEQYNGAQWGHDPR